MGRFLVGGATTGVIKSIQHFSASQSTNDYTADVTISAVNTSNSVIVANPQWNSEYGSSGYDVVNRSGGGSSPAYATLSSSTNVQVVSDNLDMFSGYTFGTLTGTYYGTVIEYEL